MKPLNKKIRFLKANDYVKAPVLTIQKKGNLTFSKSAVKVMGITEGSNVSIGVIGRTLFLKVSDEEEEDSFSVVKSGSVLYTNVGGVFDYLGLNYKRYKIKLYPKKVDKNTYKLKKKQVPRVSAMVNA